MFRSSAGRTMASATNAILTGLAVADGLTMVAYLPFALRFYVLYGTETSPERNSLTAVQFMLFYACFSVVVHTVSIWLTVVLAVFRYTIIRYPARGAELCSLPRARLAVVLTVSTCPAHRHFRMSSHLAHRPSDGGYLNSSPSILW